MGIGKRGIGIRWEGREARLVLCPWLWEFGREMEVMVEEFLNTDREVYCCFPRASGRSAVSNSAERSSKRVLLLSGCKSPLLFSRRDDLESSAAAVGLAGWHVHEGSRASQIGSCKIGHIFSFELQLNHVPYACHKARNISLVHRRYANSISASHALFLYSSNQYS